MKTKDCPWCEGDGRFKPRGFACGSAGCKVMRGDKEIECLSCNGTGKLTDWQEKGRMIQNTRVAGKGKSLRERADELGIAPVLLSDIEHGKADPEIYYQNPVIRKECERLKSMLSCKKP